MAMVKFGADEILRMDDSQGLSDESIDELLRKGEEKTEETNARIQKDMQVCPTEKSKAKQCSDRGTTMVVCRFLDVGRA